MRLANIMFQSVRLEGTAVSILDNEHYSKMYLDFKDAATASKCYEDTVRILTQAYEQLTQAGWHQAYGWSDIAPQDS